MAALIKFTIYNLQFTIKFLVLILIAFICTFYIVHSTFIKPAYAQTLTPLPPTVSPVSPLYTDLLVNNLFHSFSCLAIGQSVIGQPCLTYQVTQNAQGAIQSVPMLSSVNLSGGTLGAVTGVIGALYQNPPVRTADYLASLGQGLGIVKTANAQVVGSGAAVLNPILKLWQVSRNISYVIMIIIFVIIGLMVMFRNRINPQTVITAQAALPGLVIGLILITFSYFLAGLISDMAFVGTNVVGYYFATAQAASSPSNSTPKAPLTTQDISAENILTIFSRFVGVINPGDISGFLSSIFSTINGTVTFWIRSLGAIIAFQTGASFGGPIGSLIGPAICTSTVVGAIIAPFCSVLGQIMGGAVIGGALGGIAYAFPSETFGLVFYFVALAILIYTMFKLLLRLINSYLTIIFLTISAPFQFLIASLPGRQGMATGWILNMLGNILAFPAVFAVFYFVAFLWGPRLDKGQIFGITQPLNLIGSQLPLFGNLKLDFIPLLLGFGALLATPAIPDIIIRAVGKASEAGQLIGQEISGSTRAGQGYIGRFGAAPGQAMRGLGPLQQLGPTYTTAMGEGGPITVKTPGLMGRLGGKGPTAL